MYEFDAVFDLETVRLTYSGHPSRQAGVCLLEATAWLAGEEHSDHPQCVSRLLASFGRRLNDQLLDLNSSDRRLDLEPKLRSLIPRLIGTSEQSATDRRAAWLVMDWLVRKHIPRFLDGDEFAGDKWKTVHGFADALKAWPKITEGNQLPLPVLDGLRKELLTQDLRGSHVGYLMQALSVIDEQRRDGFFSAMTVSSDVCSLFAEAISPENVERDQEEWIRLFEKMLDLYKSDHKSEKAKADD